MYFSNYDCERLVDISDKNGNVTYQQIKNEFPELSSEDLYDWIGTPFRFGPDYIFDTRIHEREFEANAMLIWVNCPKDYCLGYQFKPEDTFSLSRKGIEVRREVESHRKLFVLTALAAISGMLSVLITAYQIILQLSAN